MPKREVLRARVEQRMLNVLKVFKGRVERRKRKVLKAKVEPRRREVLKARVERRMRKVLKV